MRIGIGYDIHKLIEGRKLVLGGIEIPHKKGLLGHSDADVLLHALADAILGAAALGDIGIYFPPDRPEYKDISSKEILKKAYALASRKGYSIGNIDSVIIAGEPKIAPVAEDIRKSVSGILDIDSSRVSVKAKTNQGIGETGRGEAIAAYAVVGLEGGA
jgi:2-C-methyl-D-erythritol 2,4-cyclodiphosphate synthase